MFFFVDENINRKTNERLVAYDFRDQLAVLESEKSHLLVDTTLAGDFVYKIGILVQVLGEVEAYEVRVSIGILRASVEEETKTHF